MVHWIFLIPWNVVTETAPCYQIDPNLVGAIIRQESFGNPDVTRFEPHYRWATDVEKFAKKNMINTVTEEHLQKTSWGLMQIMGGTARGLGFEGQIPKLLDPKINITWGCILIRKLFKRYNNLDDVISSYNQGSPRKMDGGAYRNQHYVNSVLKHLEELEKIQ